MSDEIPVGPGEDTPEVSDAPPQPTTPSTPGLRPSWPTAPSSRRSNVSGDGSDLIDLPRTAPTFRPLAQQPVKPEPKTDEPAAPETATPAPAAQPETPVQAIAAGRPILKSRRWTPSPSQPPATPAPSPETPPNTVEPAPTQEQPTTPDVTSPDAATLFTPASTPADSDAPEPIPAPTPEASDQVDAQPGDTAAETPASTPAAEQTPETQLGDGGSGDGGGEIPPAPPTPDEGEPEEQDDSTSEVATEVIAAGDTLVEAEEKPEKKKRKGLVWFLLAALLIIIAIILLLSQCSPIASWLNPNSNPSGYPTDMESHLIVPEDPAIMDPEFQEAADAVGDVYQGGFVIDSVGLNIPLGEVNAVEGVLNPPGFDRAYVVRNMGVLPADATQGTVYVVLHTIVGGKGPGNYLIDPPKQTTTLRAGDLIKVGNLTYKYTGFRLIPRDELSAHPDLWTSEPNRLIIITCMLHPDININTITDNMVIFGELVS